MTKAHGFRHPQSVLRSTRACRLTPALAVAPWHRPHQRESGECLLPLRQRWRQPLLIHGFLRANARNKHRERSCQEGAGDDPQSAVRSDPRMKEEADRSGRMQRCRSSPSQVAVGSSLALWRCLLDQEAIQLCVTTRGRAVRAESILQVLQLKALKLPLANRPLSTAGILFGSPLFDGLQQLGYGGLQLWILSVLDGIGSFEMRISGTVSWFSN